MSRPSLPNAAAAWALALALFLVLNLAFALAGCGASARRAAPAGVPAADAGSSANPGHPYSARLAVGGTHACYVDSAHALWCWGGNAAGQAGNGMYAPPAPADRSDPGSADLPSPFPVPALRGRAAQVAAGGRNTCAITVDGELWCWGDIEGDPRFPAYDPRPRRRDIGGKAAGVWVQADHACALRGDGVLLCWGRNDRGQTGAAPAGYSDTAAYPRKSAAVTGVGRVRQACVGWDFSCALDGEGKVFCWGGGAQGRSPADALLPGPVPEPVALPAEAASLACGEDHACALDGQGQAWCWGRGSGTPTGAAAENGTSRIEPYRLSPTLPALEQLALGNRFTVGLERGGEGRVWSGSSMAPMDPMAPIPLMPPGTALDHAVEIAANGTTACAVREEGSVWCWGTGQNYQLGNGKREDSRIPVRVPLRSK